MQPVTAGHGGQAQIGDDKPLRGCRAVIGVGTGHAGLHHINAGFKFLDRIAHRQGGGHILIDLVLNDTLA